MTKATPKMERDAALRWVPLDQIHVSATAQRELNPSRVDRILANLDLEQIGVLTVSARDDQFFVIDGQHRHAALTAFFAEEPDIKVQCWAYFGLTEEQEADRFLKLNDTLGVSAFAKFKVGVTAGRLEETDIDRIVRANGGVVTQQTNIPGAIAAVGALRTIYTRSGPGKLARALRVAHAAYGDPGFEGPILTAVSLVLDRYGSDVQDERLVATLGKSALGTKGIIQRGETYRLQTGNLKSHCIAAAIVDTYNAGLGPRAALRLPSWWKDAE